MLDFSVDWGPEGQIMLTISFAGQKSSVDNSCDTLISNSSYCERSVRKVRGIGLKKKY